MHEYSLVRTLLDQVQEIARQHAATAVAEVVIAVGPLSGVEPLLLQSAFQRMAPSELLEHTQLTIQNVPLVVECESCGRQSNLSNFVFACQHCESSATRVVSGEDIMLRHVMLNVPVAEEVRT
jgi:hydrogenase nickel incorporation protein HypA/HybF